MTPSTLSILVGALVVDAVTATFLLVSGKGGTKVREWYRTLGMGAAAMDVLSLVIGTYAAHALASRFHGKTTPPSLGSLLAASLLVQMLHDLAFGQLVSKYASASPLFTLFQEYADEMHWNILAADALMMMATMVLVTRGPLAWWSTDAQAAAGATAAYALLLSVYSY